MKFLFLETIHGKWEELIYSSCVAKKIAAQIRKMGHEVKEINSPTPEIANKAIKTFKPDVVWWCGHGNQHVTTLEHVKVWINAPKYNTGILNGIVACAESCLTGVYLGLYEVKKSGCMAYMGYKDFLYFMWCGKNDNCACCGKNNYGVNEDLWKKMVECPHESILYFVLGIAKGMDAKKAKDYSIARFNYWLKYFENYKTNSKVEHAMIHVMCWILEHNRNASVLYGKYEAKSRKHDIVKMTAIAALVLLGGGVVYAKEHNRI